MSYIRSQRGQASVELLALMVLGVVIFGSIISYWSAMVRIQQAEHLKNYYLDRCRLEGYLTSNDEAEMRSKFEKIGLTITQITAPAEPVKRSLDTYPVIELVIKTEFTKEPFLAGLFLGKEDKPTPEFFGKVISEYAGP